MTVPVVLLNTVVLSLGVFHILYGWLIAVLFYGTLLLGLLRWHPVRREQIKKDLPPVSGNLRHPAFAASPAQQSKKTGSGMYMHNSGRAYGDGAASI